ncbi:hypothetical protein ACFZAE_09375 [Streptomyces scabiei]|uniref:hypothetical protein n=1 Tax=Streptomyces TaxID=1883 RepID=UPI001C251D28|nr:hypothetical protein [Streptomyces sp. AC495_CC817]
MRRPAIAAAVVIALASLGLGAPTASATSADESVCGEEWPNSRDGNLRVWQDWGCQGILLGTTPGNDRFWGDSGNEGVFNSPDHLAPSSVMNSGFLGGKDVVAFYAEKDYQSRFGYVCLAPGELWADNLTDNTYQSGAVVNDNIRSHQWVTASACAAGTWLT